MSRTILLRAMGYRTAFDVMQAGFQWWMPLLIGTSAILLVGIGAALRRSGDQELSLKGLLFQCIGLIGVLAAVVFFVARFREYHAATRALSTHDYAVAEGVVSDFVPMPPGGHSTESFRVGGVLFKYIDSEWNKGLIHNGVQARITYHDKDILKVEVR